MANEQSFSFFKRFLSRPLHGLPSAHPKYITRLYLTVTAVILLIIGLSTTILGTKPNFEMQPRADTAPLGQSQNTQPIQSEEITTMPDDASNKSTNDTNVTMNSDDTSTSVSVNGETLNVPENGSMSKSYESNDGSTKVDVSVDNNSTGSTTSRRSRLDIRSNNSSSTSTHSTMDVHSQSSN